MTTNSLQEAQRLDGWGFNVFPAGYQDKAPLVKWKQYQDRRTTEMLKLWFSGPRPSNWWVATGRISGVVVLDIDSEQAEEYWQQRLPDELAATTCSRTAKGHHYWFAISTDDLVPSWSHHDEATGLQWDVRAEGTGVVAPPSVHESGHVYEWIRDPSHLQPLPDVLRTPDRGGVQTEQARARSQLAGLLSDVPVGEGGRNIWLAKVAGHYAKAHRRMQDLYLIECQRANLMLEPPLGDAEFTKTVTSIWDSEQAKDADNLAHANEDNGYLLSGGDHLLTPVFIKQDDQWVEELRTWATFDLRAKGVVDHPDAERTYDVEVQRRRQGDVREALLPSRVLSDGHRLDQWLAEFGVVITPPMERQHTKVRPSARLQLYLESQDPPHFAVEPALGWNGTGFICHEGVLRDDGLHGFAGSKPDPILRNRAPYVYGIGPAARAQKILREVLRFHFPTVASVFGAWWAACFLKPQLQEVCSQFPFMALEAPSESGKTTGMFSKLIQLNGNAQGQTSYTPASLRNALASHRSGIVWIDDEDSLDHLMQLLRMATGEGSYTKMSEDHHTSVTVQLVAPILVSGEALQMGDQKALRDRAVMLEVPSPTGRRSHRDPDRLQWDDIVALTRRFPDLTEFAGSMVQSALSNSDVVELVPELRGNGGKRFGDKIAVVRVGARLLARMTDDASHVDVVDRWVDEQVDTGAENALTLKLLPQALQVLGWPREVEAAQFGRPPTPVFYRPDPGEKLSGLWFSPAHLAIWWEQHRRGRVESRTESLSAIEQQARALGMPDRVSRVRVSGDKAARPSYWQVPEGVAELVVRRSQGERADEEPLPST